MIVTENFNVNGKLFIRTYSNENRYVVRGGESYEVAEDPAEFGRKYTEGDYLPQVTATDGEKAAAYDVLMGVTE